MSNIVTPFSPCVSILHKSHQILKGSLKSYNNDASMGDNRVLYKIACKILPVKSYNSKIYGIYGISVVDSPMYIYNLNEMYKYGKTPRKLLFILSFFSKASWWPHSALLIIIIWI